MTEPMPPGWRTMWWSGRGDHDAWEQVAQFLQSHSRAYEDGGRVNYTIKGSENRDDGRRGLLLVVDAPGVNLVIPPNSWVVSVFNGKPSEPAFELSVVRCP